MFFSTQIIPFPADESIIVDVQLVGGLVGGISIGGKSGVVGGGGGGGILIVQ